MDGGGPFKLAAGQITDDSELAMMMMHGLLDESFPKGMEKEEDRNYLVLDNIALFYSKWMCSPPFDIGKTTFKALKGTLEGDEPKWKRVRDKA